MYICMCVYQKCLSKNVCLSLCMHVCLFVCTVQLNSNLTLVSDYSHLFTVYFESLINVRVLFACCTYSVTNFTRERYICVILLETLDESPQEFLKVHPSAGLDTLGTRDLLIINPFTAVTAIWRFEGITHAAICLT